MTPAQIQQLADKILRELSPAGEGMARHYAWLEATQPHRPDYSNLVQALNTSSTYKELGWVLTDCEMVEIDMAILKRLKRLSGIIVKRESERRRQ